MMAAAQQMPRPPYPPMQYHAPQSTSPAQVPSPAQHEQHQQHRAMYGQPPPQPMQQTMYYQPQHSPYQNMGSQPPPPGYPSHAPVAHQNHQTMTTQPTMMMPQSASHNPIAPQPHQHPTHHAQPPMPLSNSPRLKMELKMESKSSVKKTSQQQQQQQQHQQPLPQAHPAQNGGGHISPPSSTASGANGAPAPGPIPATTPLIVRQDRNGVQWIKFEYSRDRVKMEYTIRCDVESVDAGDLDPVFRKANCVYPRACCAKEEYRGNRQQYESECNAVGWALAHLNPTLREKRGLIQRAVDSWRNSNQDPKLRSRRVRRMAKNNSRKASAAASQSPHMAGHPGAPGMHGAPPPMAQPTPMGKPGMGTMSPAMHHHPGHPQEQGQPTGEEVGMFQPL
ncbi:hypothetical protein IMZ48_16990 [Candidatus Bathyarchaeota archaeon]|nr:hypothetical protein [Candidatus Bathyarchaeota archaeon]